MAFPYRADHVGSLLRPDDILEARSDPQTTPDQLRQIEDRHILRILDRQREAGLRIFTDGEFRRSGFMGDFYASVDGLDRDTEIARRWHGNLPSGGSPKLAGIVTAKLRQTRRLAKDQADFLRRHSSGDVKITLPTPNQFPAIAYQKGISERAYPTRSEFLWDIVEIVRTELQHLADEGVNYLQIDAPRYSYYIDPKWRQYIRDEMEMDPAEALDEAIRADNACLDGIRREGLTVAMHLCRGNNRSQWYAEGGYDPIAEKLFNELNVDAFLLEYDSDRAGTFEPLRFVPPGKTVVLGLISSKSPVLESQSQLMKRIDEASRYLPLERLALSPQCGFASAMEGNLLTEEDQWRKLELVVKTANEVWKTR